MAKQVKKTTQTSSKKRVSQKRGALSKLKKSILVVSGVFLMISMVSFGYYLGQNGENGRVPQKEPVSESKILMDEMTKTKTEKPVEKKCVTEKKRTPQKVSEKPIEKKRTKPVTLKKRSEVKTPILLHTRQKPKLAIIIDDVSSPTQLRHIQSLGLKLTPSIFPPFTLSPANQKLAKGLEHYMVHLPMESGKRYDKHTKTLMIADNEATVQARVREIRRLFPDAVYVNNHTGSQFTKDYAAMKRLYRILLDEGFVFVDSRTTVNSKVPSIAKRYGKRYISRDVFIDNDQNIVSIHRQLRQAVSIAKRKGYAVAIGHPYSMTFKALSQARSILREVELVYIDELQDQER